jgi:hypothetical protein
MGYFPRRTPEHILAPKARGHKMPSTTKPLAISICDEPALPAQQHSTNPD